MLRNRQEFDEQPLRGLDLHAPLTKTEPGWFSELQNLMAIDESGTLQRKPGSTSVSAAISSTVRVARMIDFFNPSLGDEMVAAVHRTSNTDALYRSNGTTWTLIGALPATAAKYDMVVWRNKVYIFDGVSTAHRIYDGTNINTAAGTNTPTKVQYGVPYQGRLVVGGGQDNNHRIWFTDVLSDNFQTTSFHDIDTTHDRDIITGLGVNAINTSDTGAQNQLAVLKLRSVATIFGELGSGNEILTIRSSKVGCPSHKTIANSPYGLIFMGNDSVYLLDQTAGEPLDIGIELGTKIPTATNLENAVGTVYNTNYHLSVGFFNSTEYTLSLEPREFSTQPGAKHIWYGPHTGDTIENYTVHQLTNVLYATEYASTELWKVMVAGNHFSMSDQVTPRLARAVPRKIITQNLRQFQLDAIGGMFGLVSGSQLTFKVVAASNPPFAPVLTYTWSATTEWGTSGWSGFRIGAVVVRPRLRGGMFIVNIEHQRNEDFYIHSLYTRIKHSRKQQQR